MIAFRLDANPSVASGHLVRCMAIAGECVKAGEDCVFLLADDGYRDVVLEHGFHCHVLGVPYDDWDRGIDPVREYLISHKIRVLVVDSYLVTPGFFEGLCDIARIFYLDDLCRQPYCLDTVLHYSEWPDDHLLADLYAGRDVRVLAGLSYIPLRPEFAADAAGGHSGNPASDGEKEQQWDILLTTGGADHLHLTKLLLEKIEGDGFFREQKVVAVLGAMNKDVAELREKYVGNPHIRILYNISNMHEVIRESRFAVCGGGTTVYELMSSGTPFICVGMSEDQVILGQRLERHGNALYAGDAVGDREGACDRVLELLKKMAKMPETERSALIEKNRRLVDCRGAERIAQVLREMGRK